MEDSISTPATVLRLDSAHPILDDPFAQWDNGANNGSSAALDLGMNANMGVGILGGSINTFPQDLDYQMDAGLLDGISTIPFTPSYDLDAFTTFDDPFPPYTETLALPQPPIEAQSSRTASAGTLPKEEKPENKLLSFKPPTSKYALFTSSGQQTWPSITAELLGMFFVAEDVFGEPAPEPGRPTELTCYRRNLFQISANIVMSRDIKSIVTEAGAHMTVFNLGATLTAVDSTEGKPAEIIAVPWKPTVPTAATPGVAVEDKTGTTPQKIMLDLHANPELDPAVVNLPISWKRLQFKHATANNGRRKGLQQNYVVKLALTGILSTGEEVKLVEVESGPIIVRGRSPRNFVDQKLAGSGASEGDAKGKATETRDVLVKVDPGVSNGNNKFYGQDIIHQPLDLEDWKTPMSIEPPLPSPSLSKTDAHVSKKTALSQSDGFTPVSQQRPPIPKTRWKSDSISSQSNATKQRNGPVDLSILDGTPHKNRTNSTSAPRTLSFSESSPVLKRRESTNIRSGSIDDVKIERRTVGSPLENADLLYEYFPLSLDDWMPPVDAIYRPHVVHHTVVPPDLRDELIKSKTKRYFSAED